MTTLLGVFSYPGANPAILRHWPFFERQKANMIYGIGTDDGKCEWPEGVQSVDVGRNQYIDGPGLPNRLLDTIELFLLLKDWDVLLLAEYDCLIFNSLPLDQVGTIAAHRAGSATWGSKAQSFYHPPWAFSRTYAAAFLLPGRTAIAEGICPGREQGRAPTPESSPDVFIGFVTGVADIPVQTDLWSEYSRNAFDIPGHLDEAREAYRNGVDVIHGVKTAAELKFILS